MLSVLNLSFIVLGYLILLFVLGFFAEKQARQGAKWTKNPFLYAMSLSVYCTTWTYYGSVGSAATNGMLFLSIYLGPTLCAVFWQTALRKLIRIKNTQKITSLADFVSSRYNKSIAIGVIATILILIGIIPYIGLQMRAIITTITIMTKSEGGADAVFSDDALGFVMIGVLTIFTIIFGLRKLDPTERHPGMMMTLTIEGVVKLIGFVGAGLFVTYSLFNGFDDIFTRASELKTQSLHFFERESPSNVLTWLTYLILAGSAILLLPRQFQVAVIENSDEKHTTTSMWAFPVYLFLINLFVIPIALGGLISGEPAKMADSFVLSLPLKGGSLAIGILVFLGGFSAGAGMIMVETMAISNMISNNLILPTLGRLNAFAFLRKRILPLRWLSAFLLILTGYLYQKANSGYALVAMGMISFSAVMQFAPIVFGGLFWKRGNQSGALMGLTAGGLIWFYTLFLPAFMKAGILSDFILKEGPFGIGFLKPEALFGLTDLHPLTHSLIWSQFFNVGLYFIGSLLSKENAEEKQYTEKFLSDLSQREYIASVHNQENVNFTEKLKQIQELLCDYYSKEQSEVILNKCLDSVDLKRTPTLTITELSELYSEIERQLAGAIGAATAHAVLKERKIISFSEQKSLSDFYAKLLADMKISPSELKRKIDFHKEREGILQNQAVELKKKIAERDEENKLKTLEIQKAQVESEKLHKKLLGTAKQAGMAEMANSVLHNVGNVLNSVNTSLSVIQEKVKFLKTDRVTQLSQLLETNQSNLAQFMTTDPKGQAIPIYLSQLSNVLDQDKSKLSKELEYLQENVNHIKNIIHAQQSQAKSLGVLEEISPNQIYEDAIKINIRSIQSHGIELHREFSETSNIICDKNKLLQILVNLIANAKDALLHKLDTKHMTLRLSQDAHQNILFEVIDNGVGIAQENLERIFQHGFTTKKDGHGFGLHSGALAAKELGGELRALSDGVGSGSNFQLKIPQQIETKKKVS